jgi:uncharacterized protein (TIGR00661 family)
MNILVAAFDWGLGHTTRSVAVIDRLRSEGHKVIIAATSAQKVIYNEHFPEIETIDIPSTSPKLSSGKKQIFAVTRYLPLFFLGIWRDRRLAKQISKLYQIDQIVSDNRYGLRSRKTYNIIITHQINVLVPKQVKIFQPLVQGIIRRYINKFDECHVPDFPFPQNLSGDLSFPFSRIKCPVKFIGILSRLQIVEAKEFTGPFPKILFILSGPENQRTEFENCILREIQNAKQLPEYLIIRGKPETSESEIPNSVNHVNAPHLKRLIQHAEYIICRAGYSTIMDIVSLNKTAILIPTPGQTEQEYLAEYLQAKGVFLSEIQEDFMLKRCISRLQKF